MLVYILLSSIFLSSNLGCNINQTEASKTDVLENNDQLMPEATAEEHIVLLKETEKVVSKPEIIVEEEVSKVSNQAAVKDLVKKEETKSEAEQILPKNQMDVIENTHKGESPEDDTKALNTRDIAVISEEEVVITNPEIREEVSGTIKEDLPEEEVVVGTGHDLWQSILSKNVSNTGVVSYSGIKANEEDLEFYLDYLRNNAPTSSDRSTAAKAYWINAYNAFTIKLILDNYPVGSIRDLDGGDPWSKKWINLGGKAYSLNNIEHDILRPFWKDARIHFAVNCAAKSCPPIANKAFTASNTENLLETLTKKFVNNSKYNTVNASTLKLSKIFEWYAEDFGNIASYIDKYTTISVDSKAATSYNPYDWSLNGK